ncbi:MAG: UvrD-helicase domain-containing protein [Oscillospiraceae bacterium]|nr:UvrD-helicase domain-containing protein [Oscillospiraceae bacterium]
MAFKPTPEQNQAITSRGGSLLVSAAAGSGKTAVLVQRVLRYFTQENCRADELLIVTFTRAAAAQMRAKIDEAIAAQLKQEPNNHALRKQQQLLPLADICTIDSFCLKLVQEHGAAAGLPAQLRLLDDSELRAIRAQAMEETLEAAYDKANNTEFSRGNENSCPEKAKARTVSGDSPQADEAFTALGLLLEFAGDDTKLARRVQATANMALATPNPAAWLQSLLEDKTAQWLKILLSHAHEILQDCRAMCFLDSDMMLVDGLLALQGWDELRMALQSVAYQRLPKGHSDQDKERRKRMKKQLENLTKLCCVSMAEHAEDMQALAPIAVRFVQLTADYIARCDAAKDARQAAEFSDILHWALQLLHNEDGSKSALAMQLGEQYREILVDEYQDINAAQGQLFHAVSRNGDNLFMVGDVKQSIYGFRQASPTLFIEKRDTYAPYDGEAYPACVVLGCNFRSKPGVTDAVNFTFRQLMRRQAAEIEYTADEELVCGRNELSVCDAELHLLEYSDDMAQAEAQHIARWIANEIAHTNLRPRDICILLRADKASGMVYAQALQDAGVQAYAAQSESLFASREIQLLLSLLRVVDNPVQDIPLTALLLSPMIGFSPDNLARLRTQHKLAGIYHVIHAAADAGDAQCVAFFTQLAQWREFAAVCAVGDLVRMLLEDSGLLALAAAMKSPARRRANLLRLADYARDYSARNAGGLSGFLRYLDRIEQEQSLLAANVMSETADVVRIMSIHKSKGLEFPVCILAQCSKSFNLLDTRETLLLHAKAGLGLQRPEPEHRSRLQTLPHHAVKTAIQRSTLAEELRLLYVAMTRAKDRLVMLSSHVSAEKALLAAAATSTFDSTSFTPAMVQGAKSYADWLLPALLRHPCAGELRDIAGLDSTITLPAAEQLRVVITQAQEHHQAAEEPAMQRPAADESLRKLVQQRLDYVYPYAALNQLAAKQAVSELTEQAQAEQFAFSQRPAFTRAHGIAAAHRGSAMHAFLQYCDYAAAAADLTGEIARLEQLGYLTARDAKALERDKLERFFASDFAARMAKSPTLLREQKFTMSIPALELLDDFAALGEEIVVQGIIDCAFEEDGALILLDYKTDRVDDMAALVERYGAQLRLYRRAMQQCFGIEVAQTLIYSFWLGDWVEI